MKYTDFRTIPELSELRPDQLLWYNTPADSWLEALPLGNGSVGAMVFGGAEKERFQLNHDTLYSDEPGTRDLDIDVDLDPVMSLLGTGKYREADDLITAKWLGRSWPCYQPVADLKLGFDDIDRINQYYRYLDLRRGIHVVSFLSQGYLHRRESFVSHPDGALALRYSTESPDGLSGSVKLTTQHPTGVAEVVDGSSLRLIGQAPGLALRRTLSLIEERHEQWKYPEIFNPDGTRMPHAAEVLYGDDIGGLGMSFAVMVHVRPDGGRIEGHEDCLSFAGVRSIELILSIATSFNGFDKSPSREGVDPAALSAATVERLSDSEHEHLKDRHTRDHSSLFDRFDLELPPHPQSSGLPTDRRVKDSKHDEDPSYHNLYLNYARYLTIAGSRPGSQPLNLQGIWNDEVIPPWASGYTININTQMNYWPAAVGNLIDCEEPLMGLVEELAVSGRRVAKEMYHLEGWVAHHNTTIWRSAQPVDNVAQTSFWPMGSGWLCRHLWDHYLFSCDPRFLTELALPLLEEASMFYLEWLVEGDDGYLVTPVGTSPENAFVYTKENGDSVQASVSSGPTMDMSIIRDCLTNTEAALTVTGSNPGLQSRIRQSLDSLLPPSVAPDGQLREWNHDYPSFQERHRHLSHLYGAFPGDQIRSSGNSQIYDAVKKTLEVRGEDSGGWSSAWKANLWARRGDGERAFRNLSRVTRDELTNPNLFNGHSKRRGSNGLFQIDGNMGGASAILEMLVQSRYTPGSSAEIDLLPALPPQWPDGNIRGARCRGGFEVSFGWKNSLLSGVVLKSHTGVSARISYWGREKLVQLEKNGEMRLDGELAGI